MKTLYLSKVFLLLFVFSVVYESFLPLQALQKKGKEHITLQLPGHKLPSLFEKRMRDFDEVEQLLADIDNDIRAIIHRDLKEVAVVEELRRIDNFHKETGKIITKLYQRVGNYFDKLGEPVERLHSDRITRLAGIYLGQGIMIDRLLEASLVASLEELKVKYEQLQVSISVA